MRWSRPVTATLIALAACPTACSQDDSAAQPYGGPAHDGSADAKQPDGDADAPADAEPSDANATSPDASPDAPPEASAADAPALYPADQTQSPITPWVAARLTEILARAPASRRDVFMKVGDSITVSGSFLHCFSGSNVALDSHASLQPTLDLYRAATVGATTPFDRTSLSAEIGRTAWWAMTGAPPPVDQEASATNASVAVVMYGTNDIGWLGDDHVGTLKWYYDNMFGLVDRLAGSGIIPILSTIPPRDDSASMDTWVPTFNAAIRGMAQGLQIPLVDFHRELMALDGHGLGSDGVHPSTYSGGACVLDASGLAKGYNVRNLITLEALDRVRRAALSGEGALDATAPALQGSGTLAEPFLVQGNPFTDLRDTRQAADDSLDTYSGCGSSADESGPEYAYRLEVTTPVRVRAVVLDRGDVDIDIHLLGNPPGEASCIARADTLISADLQPGSYTFVLDTYVSGGVEHAGQYLFLLLNCAPGDVACE